MATQTSTDMELLKSSKDVAWYQATLPKELIPPPTYELFENYSKVSRADFDAHVTKVRDKAWAVMAWPCIGQWRFLVFAMSLHPAYANILSQLKASEGKAVVERKKLLDLGCCFAQDIRKLIHDGAPADSLYACDFKPEFVDLGYQLFADKTSCKAHFIVADVFKDDSDLTKLKGQIDFVHASGFFHLFTWDDQVKVAKRIVEVLKPQHGSIVFGSQVGNVKGQEVQEPIWTDPGKHPAWRHDVESFKKLWAEVGDSTGSKWEVNAELIEGPFPAGALKWTEEGIRRFRFEVTRL